MAAIVTLMVSFSAFHQSKFLLFFSIHYDKRGSSKACKFEKVILGTDKSFTESILFLEGDFVETQMFEETMDSQK